MSKVSFSRELLGTIKFIFDKTKSRNLNATQAYDSSTSQIVLASYKGKSTINTTKNSLGGRYPPPIKTFGVTVGVNGTEFRAAAYGALQEKAILTGPEAAPKAIAVDWNNADIEAPAAAAKQTVVTVNPLPTAKFNGTLVSPNVADRKSNATKEIFAGNITVGTGLYREWQGKYAVLKVDLLTDKAILRVYNE